MPTYRAFLMEKGRTTIVRSHNSQLRTRSIRWSVLPGMLTVTTWSFEKARS